jgi:DNA gyrase subunit B
MECPGRRGGRGMTTKKLQKTLDTVRSDVRELTEAFWALRDDMQAHQAVSAAEQQSRSLMDDRSGRSVTADLLAEKTRASDSDGYLSTFGYYETTDASAARHIHRWSMEDRPIEDVLAAQTDDAAKMLAAIGHKQRLGILLLLLAQPTTAGDIVRELSLGTTGAAYHHLNVLQGVGLVQQEERGIFSLVPGRVASLLLILSGASNTIEASVETVIESDDLDMPDKKKKTKDT